MTPHVTSFGEILMRLSPPHPMRFAQARDFEINIGGAELNVAVSLAMLGLSSSFVSAAPNTPIGDRALQDLNRFGVDTSNVVRCEGRLGLYFLEHGSNQRSGQVVYDRDNSVFSTLSPDVFVWKSVLKGDWFHISGISPAVSASAAKLSLAAMKAAKRVGMKVSLDLNYRSLLWNYGAKPVDILGHMVEQVDILIAGRGDCQHALGIHGQGDPDSDSYFGSLTENVLEIFPNLEAIAVTIRASQSADHHDWKSCWRSSSGLIFSKSYSIHNVVDRVGSGDAFSAGLIYGLVTGLNQADALEFAAAANCLKHSVSGDFNLVSREEISELAKGLGQGRVKR